jgi:hypothetical protein
MWKRYSPHGELPLSGASSLALHLLIFGLMLLSAWLAYAYFSHASRSLPVEAVRLDLGGGGGDPRASGTGPGRGQKVEEAGAKTEEAPVTPEPSNDEKPPDINKAEPGPKDKFKFDEDVKRYIHRGTASSAAFQKLADANIRIRLPDGKEAGKGQGGTGSGGGSGSGKGKGIGSGEGDGKGTLTQREKRMLRWSMIFNTNNGPDYVSQLKGLGAILAIPVREDASGREYRIIRDLSARPAKLLKEDISKIQRIYWIDDKDQSVRDVLLTLGVRLPFIPSHFVAFMPEELEQKLFQLEKDYLNKNHPGRTEEDILETKFRINRTGGGYEPAVESQNVK